MILDYDNEFTTAGGQAITASADGTKVLDAGGARDWGSGECVHPFIRVTSDADFDNCTSLQFDIVADSASAMDTSPVVLSTVTILLAALTADSLHWMPALKPGSSKRYLGLEVTVNGSNPSAGKVIVGLVDGSGRVQDGVNNI